MIKVRNYQGEEVEVPEEPRHVHGCICVSKTNPIQGPDGENIWTIDPECGYHAGAAAQPWNHTIPWNCDVYWDGCNHRGGPYFYDREVGEEMDPFAWRQEDGGDDDDDVD